MTPLHPTVLWAQRKDKVYLTVEIWEVSEEKIQIEETSLTLTGTNRTTKQSYALTLPFYEPIDPEVRACVCYA